MFDQLLPIVNNNLGVNTVSNGFNAFNFIKIILDNFLVVTFFVGNPVGSYLYAMFV